GDFLEFADGLFKQTHFAESDAEVVVGFEVFILAAHFAELGAKFVKNFLKRAGFNGRGRSRRRCGRFLGRRRVNGKGGGWRAGGGLWQGGGGVVGGQGGGVACPVRQGIGLG